MMTRSYIPKDSGVTDEYAIRFDAGFHLSHTGHTFYYENIESDKQLFSMTLNKENNTVQLGFNPDKLMKFLIELKNEEGKTI